MTYSFFLSFLLSFFESWNQLEKKRQGRTDGVCVCYQLVLKLVQCSGNTYSTSSSSYQKRKERRRRRRRVLRRRFVPFNLELLSIPSYWCVAKFVKQSFFNPALTISNFVALDVTVPFSIFTLKIRMRVSVWRSLQFSIVVNFHHSINKWSKDQSWWTGVHRTSQQGKKD